MSDEAAIQVFNQLRTSRMNLLYYEKRLAQLKRVAFWIDLFTLVAVGVIGVGVWVIAASPIIDVLIKMFSVAATVVSAYGLLAKPTECAARCEAYLAVREQLYSGLMVLMRRVNAAGWSAGITKEMETLSAAAESVHLPKFEVSQNSKLLDEAWCTVNQELPTTFLQLGTKTT